ncbi:MAG: hypothetical protein ACERKT_05730, partial [Acidobacteriota bacterium]
MKQIPARAADMIDLTIEFATLGEYGLEYPEGTGPAGCRGATASCLKPDPARRAAAVESSRIGRDAVRDSRRARGSRRPGSTRSPRAQR